MEGIIKIVKSLEDSSSLIKGVTQTIENETEEQRGGFLGMLLGTLGSSLLGNMLAKKGFIQVGDGGTSPTLRETIRAGEGAAEISRRQRQDFIAAYMSNFR